MSEELFEVAFSGQIADAADLQQVKAKVAAMFKADEEKLAHLFSGKRVVIKKNIDQATANKYKTALNNAGAICEIKSLLTPPAEVAAAEKTPTPATKSAPAASSDSNRPAVSAATTGQSAAASTSGNIPAAPQTAPLGIGADDIADLVVDVAPLGSDMQDEIKQVAPPELDVSGLDVAPAGSDLGQIKKKEAPPPPDTSGMSLADT